MSCNVKKDAAKNRVYSVTVSAIYLLVSGLCTEADFCGGCLAIQGTVMAALHVYLPPSEEKTGWKERVRV